MEPASSIISALGGPSAVAKAVGIHRTRVSMWQAPRRKGGTDGLVPYRHIPALLGLAEKLGVDLSADDFMPRVIDDEAPAIQDKDRGAA